MLDVYTLVMMHVKSRKDAMGKGEPSMSIVIPIENGFAVNVFPLHTEANGWRCRNAGCVCREEYVDYDHVRCERCGKVMSLDDANAACEVLPYPHCGHDWGDYKPYHEKEKAEDRRPVITLDKNAVVKCEMAGCDRASVNTCTHCGKAVCIVHRYPAIADDGQRAYQCVECFFAS